MIYTPKYFDFDAIKHSADNAEMLLMVLMVYVFLLVVSLVIKKTLDTLDSKK